MSEEKDLKKSGLPLSEEELAAVTAGAEWVEHTKGRRCIKCGQKKRKMWEYVYKYTLFILCDECKKISGHVIDDI